MAIAIPSDLILDVMRNAAPPRTGKTGAPEVAGGGVCCSSPSKFSQVFSDISPVAVSNPDLILGMLESGGRARATNAAHGLEGLESNPLSSSASGSQSARTSPQLAFEQMVLRSTFESMLPAADSGIYGQEDASSGVWRSLFADNLATVHTDIGGLGIASSLVRQPLFDGPVYRDQWPYFAQLSLGGVSG